MEIRNVSPLFFLLSVVFKLVGAFTPADCAYACHDPLARIQFNGSTAEDDYYVAQCTNLLRAQSVFSCIKAYCPENDLGGGYERLSSDCRSYGAQKLLPWSIIDNITISDAHSWPHVGVEDLDNVNTVWGQSEATRAEYGYAMYGFWGGVFIISMVFRFSNYISERRRVLNHQQTAMKTSSRRTIDLALKRYITTPALLTQHVAEPAGWCTVPLRLQSITIFAFFVINLVLCCVSYDLFEGNLYWPTTRLQLWRYLSDRTGVISISNMPLMFAFAMRNNVLLWLTGWNFSTFNMFHRWVSRIATLEAVVHSIGYTVEAFLDGGKAEFDAEFAERYWWMGVIATIVMCFLCGFSIYPIRRMFYELFLIVHIVLAVLFLVGMWYHVAIFEGQYDPFIWPCVAVWIFDRVLRFCRIGYLNLPSFNATATYCPDAEVIRINIPVRSGLKPKPSTHYYIYDLNNFKFWESHPFTLSKWDTTSTPQAQQTLSFVVRPHNSFTARVRDKLVRTQNKKSTHNTARTHVRLAIEGPYGHGEHLARYNSVLLIIGGSGITVALSHIQALHEALSSNPNLPLRKVHLVWAVRKEAFYEDVHKHELAAWLSSSPLATKAEFRVDTYVTRSLNKSVRLSIDNTVLPTTLPTVDSQKSAEAQVTSHGNTAQPENCIIEISETNPDTVSTSKEKEITTTSSLSSSHSDKGSHVTVSSHRPDIHNIVLSAAETWCVRDERLAVVSCGPAGMADDTRAAVVAAYAKGHEGIDLHSEAFNW